ncbi:MAG: nucleotidyl transferase AbiEii/AbiGii toxin family protein [Euzebya sp.]
MNGLFSAAREIQDLCDEQGWRFCFIGGLAVLRWGEPRQTRDVDLTLLTGFGGEEPFVDRLLERFAPRVPDAKGFALKNRVLLLRSDDGVGLDVALGAMTFEEHAVDRATGWRIDQSLVLQTCSAHDLVVYKVFAGRPQDWIDVEMIIARRSRELDMDLVQQELVPLLELKGAEEDWGRLQGLLGTPPGLPNIP